MRVLGITGGIATGKSTVTQMLAALGAPTISADVIAHSLLAPGGTATFAVLDAFPGCASPADPSGQTIDRRALGRLVFADKAARLRLESLTHPAIIAALQKQIAAWWAVDAPGAAAAEIPLLFEAGLEADVDQVVVVVCAEAVQIARMISRGIDEAEAVRHIAAQWPLAEKVARADFVITTDGDLDDTRRQVETFWHSL